MSGVNVSSWRKNALSGLVLLLGLAFVAKVAFEWLMPLVPAFLVILALMALLGGLLKLRQR
jgi:hypothetical protein